MSDTEIAFFEVPNRREFPEDIRQCLVCQALVLAGSEEAHLMWHRDLDRGIARASVDAVVARQIASGVNP